MTTNVFHSHYFLSFRICPCPSCKGERSLHMRTIRRHMRRAQMIESSQAAVFSLSLTNLTWGNNASPDVDMTSVTDEIDIEPIQIPQIDISCPDPLTDVDFELSVTDTDAPVHAISAALFGDDDLFISQSSETNLNVPTLFEPDFEEDFPDLDSLSIVSLTNTSTASSTDDKEQECVRRLYFWSTRFSISRVAKNDLLALLRDVAFPKLPMDWRTLEKRQKAELSHINEFSQHSAVHDYVVTVCGNCFLYRYDQNALNLVTPCSHCNVSRLNCGMLNCTYPYVITESLGQRSMNTIDSCDMCLVDSDCKQTVRAYGYHLATFVHRVFGDRRAALSLLAPFKNHFVYEPDTFTLSTSPSWYMEWMASIQDMPFKSELFHGHRFYSNPIWKSSAGMRSIILALSIDWFPPFKSQEYSIGVVSVIPANLSVTDRANVSNLWPVVIIEGPKEPLHTLFLLEELCTEINHLDEHGLVVYDSLTNTNICVHLTLGPVIADTPANTKIGDHTAHAGYFACIACRYRGSLCGCKTKPNEPAPAKFDNYYYGGGPRAIVSGKSRPKRKGEHISWTDSDVIIDRHMRSDDEHRKNQVTVMRKRLSQPFVAAQYDRMRKLLLVNAISPLAFIMSFQFTRSFVVESMHVILKGMLLTQLKLTLDKVHKLQPWCIHKTTGATKILVKRLKWYKFHKGHNQPYRVLDRFKRLKCAELLDFLRVCTANVFYGLISDEAAMCWWYMSRLYCGLLHTHVNSDWVTNHSRLADFLKIAYEKYEAVYSACHMPSNFHRVLHCRIDFKDWGPMRSHWAFPFERLYQSIMRAANHCNRKHVVMSVLNTLSNVNRLSTNSDAAGRRKTVPGKPITDMTAEVSTMLQTGWRNVATYTDKYGSVWSQFDDVFFLFNGDGPTNKNCSRIVGILQSRDKRRTTLVLRYMVVEWSNEFPRYHFSYDPKSLALKEPMFIADLDRDGLNYAIVQVAKFVERDLFDEADGRNFVIPFCGPLPY